MNKTFRQYLTSYISFNHYKNNYLLINESFDSSLDIVKTDKIENTSRYYVLIGNKEYRIFIENDINHLHIGFERLSSKGYTIDGINNDLSTKEIMSLFGTVRKIILSKKFYSINVYSKEHKKISLYKKILYKFRDSLSDKIDLNYAINGNWQSLYSESKYTPNFKYKLKQG